MDEQNRSEEPLRNRAMNSPEVTGLLLTLRDAECDEETFGDAFGALLGHYLPLIEKIVTQFSESALQGDERDDLRQEALMSLYRAATTYDLQQANVSFGLYAQICITNRMISCVRRMKRLLSERPLSLAGEEELPTPVSDEPAASLLAKERVENTYAVIRRVLSPFEFSIWQYYVGGSSAKEIAAALGKNEKAVSNAIGRIRKKLKASRSEFDF